MFICLCKGITESQVREFGRSGVVTPDEIASALGIDDESCCGRCMRNIESFVTLAISEWNTVVAYSTQDPKGGE
jgi:bacterioferritin-associated ferredoxin